MKTSSNSVYQAIFSDDQVIFCPIIDKAPLKKIGFVVAGSISEMIKLKSEGVNFIFIDEDINHDSTIYQLLNPTITLSGPVPNLLMPEYFLSVLSTAISKSCRMRIRINLGVDFFYSNDEGV
jgi:hypothetical protein